MHVRNKWKWSATFGFELPFLLVQCIDIRNLFFDPMILVACFGAQNWRWSGRSITFSWWAIYVAHKHLGIAFERTYGTAIYAVAFAVHACRGTRRGKVEAMSTKTCQASQLFSNHKSQHFFKRKRKHRCSTKLGKNIGRDNRLKKITLTYERAGTNGHVPKKHVGFENISTSGITT